MVKIADKGAMWDGSLHGTFHAPAGIEKGLLIHAVHVIDKTMYWRDGTIVRVEAWSDTGKAATTNLIDVYYYTTGRRF